MVAIGRLCGLAGLLVVAVSCASRAPDAVPQPAGGSPLASTKPLWSAGDSLPVLARTLLNPIEDGAQFEFSSGMFEFRAAPDQLPAKQAPFEDDADAVCAATKWVRANFAMGDLGFEATSIWHSASGDDAPRDEADRGHTIVLRELCNGMRTDGEAVVHLTGSTVTSAYVTLYSYAPVPGTEKLCVSEEVALTHWQSWLKRQGAFEDLSQLARETAPRLVFTWSPMANSVERKQDVEVPTWVPLENIPFRVDGHSGRPWWDD